MMWRARKKKNSGIIYTHTPDTTIDITFYSGEKRSYEDVFDLILGDNFLSISIMDGNIQTTICIPVSDIAEYTRTIRWDEEFQNVSKS